VKSSSTLLAGVDTLAIGFKIGDPNPEDDWELDNGKLGFYLTPDEWANLKDAKYAAQGEMFDSGGTPILFRGQTFSVSPKGGPGYEYRLINDDMTLMLAELARGGSSFPEVHITFRSAYLWRHGWRGCYTRVRSWLDGWANVVGHHVSRVDLCMDLNLPLPVVDLRVGEVVTPAKNKSEFFIQHHFKGLDETGYTFGQGKLRCRIYDKLAEIDHSQKMWFKDLWRKQGWNGRSPVTRVEFQARRDFLRTMQIETVEDLENQMADLWRYYTGAKGWVSLREQSPTDSNRRRWPIKDFWLAVVKSSSAFGVVTGIVRLTQRKPRVDTLNRLAQGVLVTLMALTVDPVGSNPRLEDIQLYARSWLSGVLGGVDFGDRVKRRCGKLATMTV